MSCTTICESQSAMTSLVYIWSLVFVCGVLSESLTHPASGYPSELDIENYASSIDAAYAAEDWKPYSSDVYPLFKTAIQTLASSERGILILWDYLNRPEPPRAFYEQIFRAYNHMVDEEETSIKTEEYETTVDILDSTEAKVSELIPDVHTTEESVEMEDPEALYHTSISSDDVVDVYYTTENPEAEVVVLDESYMSSISPDEHASKDLDMDVLYEDVGKEADVVSETVESEADALENLKEEIVRRSGLLEKHPPAETGSSSLPLRVGSIRGIPCVDFPCYEEIPITSFTCADKQVPGFYADLETGCQIFHVCWSNRMESFLCPIGTTFNQPIAACDYWYSSNCSLSPHFFGSKSKGKSPGCKKACNSQETESSHTEHHATEKPESHLPDDHPLLNEDWFRSSKFVPVKTKVTVYFKSKVHSKLPSSKKTASKTVLKQKHNIMPLVEGLLDLTETVAEDAVKLVPKVVKPEIAKSKLVLKPAAKLVPCLKINDRHHPKPTPAVVLEPKPLPTLNPRFIVKPVEVKKPLVEVHYEKKKDILSPKVLEKQVKPNKVHKTNAVHPGKDHASEIVLKALEMAGDVFQRDILALTRQVMTDSKSKH